MWETSQKDQRPSDLTICWYILCMWVLARRDLEVFDSMLLFFFFFHSTTEKGGVLEPFLGLCGSSRHSP